MERKITKRERRIKLEEDKGCPVQLFTTCSSAPSPSQQQSAAPSQSPPVSILSVTFYEMEHPFDQFGSTGLAMHPPGFLFLCSLAEHGKLKSPWLRVSCTQQHQYVINIILRLNPKPSSVSAARKKITSVLAKTRTTVWKKLECASLIKRHRGKKRCKHKNVWSVIIILVPVFQTACVWLKKCVWSLGLLCKMES